MPTCECGLTYNGAPADPLGRKHRTGKHHKQALTQRWAERLGMTHRAPLALTGRYLNRVRDLGATEVTFTVYEGPEGTDRELTSTLIAEAIFRMGVPSPPSLKFVADVKEAEQDAPGSLSMHIALTLAELYGEDATAVWWKVAVLNEDKDARQGVIAALKANGAPVTKLALGSFHKHAFDALLVMEAERVRLKTAQLEAESPTL